MEQHSAKADGQQDRFSRGDMFLVFTARARDTLQGGAPRKLPTIEEGTMQTL